MESHKKNVFNTVLLSVVLSVVASMGVFFILQRMFIEQKEYVQGTDKSEVSANSERKYSGATNDEERTIAVVRESTPAVISIVVTKDMPILERYYDDQSPESFFDQFFGGGLSQPQYRENGTREEEIGGGSGFFVSENGLVVTNRHVVRDTEAGYTVVTSSGEEYEATVLAVDPIIDVAVLKVAGSNFPYLNFADSDQIQPGQSAIAIGNALAEFQNSVSVGVVSGLSRSIVAGNVFGQGEVLDALIQTDAAINPGNSGGPLLNLAGEVIGVNVAVAQGVENIGFALPANVVAQIARSVEEHGEIIRPYLGIRYMMITQQLQERNNLSVDYGVLIQRGEDLADLAVIPGSPADKAGLRENDIILTIDDKNVSESTPLAQLLRTKEVGQSVMLRVLRENEEQKIEVLLEKAPSGNL